MNKVVDTLGIQTVIQAVIGGVLIVLLGTQTCAITDTQIDAALIKKDVQAVKHQVDRIQYDVGRIEINTSP